MNRLWKRILPLAALWLVSISLPVGAYAKVPARAHPVHHRPSQGPPNNARQGPSDHELLLQLRDGQQASEREIADLKQSVKDLRQSLKDIRQSYKENSAIAGESARDANANLVKQTAQGFQMLDGRISFIRTLLVLTFIALLAVLGGTLLIWQRLAMLGKSLGQRLVTVEQRVSDIREQSNKWVAGP